MSLVEADLDMVGQQSNVGQSNIGRWLGVNGHGLETKRDRNDTMGGLAAQSVIRADLLSGGRHVTASGWEANGRQRVKNWAATFVSRRTCVDCHPQSAPRRERAGQPVA